MSGWPTTSSCPSNVDERALLRPSAGPGRSSTSRRTPRRSRRWSTGSGPRRALYALAETLRVAGTAWARQPVDAAEYARSRRRGRGRTRPRKVIVERRRPAREEKKAIDGSARAARRGLADSDYAPSSKWPQLVEDCLEPNGIEPGGVEQPSCSRSSPTPPTGSWSGSAHPGFTAERYSGRDPHSTARRGAGRVRSRRLPGHRLDRRWQRGHRPADRARARQLGHPVVARAPRAADGAHPPGRPDRGRRALQPDRHRHPRRRGSREVFSTTSSPRPTSSTARCSTASASLASSRSRRLVLATSRSSSPRPTSATTAAALAVDAVRAHHEGTAPPDARPAARLEDFLKSGIDMNKAVAALHEEALERINPHIVERIPRRVAAAGS